MIKTQKTQSFIGIAISICLIFFVVKQIDVAKISQILQRTDPFWLAIALVFYWMEILLRILRWKRILISVDRTIGFSPISSTFIISTAANNLFPFRLGDILRAHLLGIQINCSRFTLMGTIVLEKIIDVISVLLLAYWGAFGVLDKLGITSKLNLAILMVGAGILGLGGVFLITKNRAFSNKLLIFFHEKITSFKVGFGILFRPVNLFFVIGETLVIWIFNMLAIWAIIKALGMQISASEMILLEGITGVAACIPSAPAGIGTLQYAFLLTFEILQLDKSVGVAASILVQACMFGSITLVGVLIYSFDSKSRKALRRIRHA